MVRRGTQRPEWDLDLIRATSTGLACGNTGDEALLHCLYEVVERDVLCRGALNGGRYRILIDPVTVDDPRSREGGRPAGGRGHDVRVGAGGRSVRLPVCVACLWSGDYPVVFAGGGCHSSPAIALARALKEAAQSRLTVTASGCLRGGRWAARNPARVHRGHRGRASGTVQRGRHEFVCVAGVLTAGAEEDAVHDR
ncbi:YcaO-like family protein [Streptomyces sp. NPDC056796]|uniref:YcaO-like family protein n=1 Tax=Streptomyces sp. NPDC056796 TaxID=3345947 RepID=UPI00368BDE94